MHWKEETNLYNNTIKKSFEPTLGEKLFILTVPQKKLDHGWSQSWTNEQMNKRIVVQAYTPSATTPVQPVKASSLLHEGLQEYLIGVPLRPVYFQTGVPAKCRSNKGRMTVNSANSSEEETPRQPHYRTINLYLNFTEALHERGNMATPTTITIGYNDGWRGNASGKPKQPTINKDAITRMNWVTIS